MSGVARAVGLLAGYAADRALGDPRRGHPVAAFGTVAGGLEQRIWADSRPRGALHCAALVGAATALGAAGGRAVRGRPAGEAAVVALATWTVLGGTSLEREARTIGAWLVAGDLDAARARLPHLVGRDPSALDADGVARAVVESVAENTSDAVVAPLVWGALAGAPGLLAYRAANTLDAMVGHRTPRHERFGWASARLDDLLNLPGARLSGLLAVAAGPDHTGARRAWRRDAASHPSPNAGVVEAAYAGALGLRLGGETAYPHRVEQRPVLGDGRAPVPADVERAVRLARRVQLGSVLVAAAVALVLPRRAGTAAGT